MTTLPGHVGDPSKTFLEQSAKGVASTWEAHQSKLRELEDPHGKPAAVEATVAGLAAAIDELLSRSGF